MPPVSSKLRRTFNQSHPKEPNFERISSKTPFQLKHNNTYVSIVPPMRRFYVSPRDDKGSVALDTNHIPQVNTIHSFIKQSFVKYQINDKYSIFMKNNI
jgi:hypothetical protein